MTPKIATVGLAHPYEVGFQNAASLLSETVQALEATGIECINTNVVVYDNATVKQATELLRATVFDVLMVCVATWSEDNHLLDLLSLIDVPVIIRPFPNRETG